MTFQVPSRERPMWGRTSEINATISKLCDLEPPYTIVEIGSIRNPEPSGRVGDGHATMAWAWITERKGGKVFSVDIDPKATTITTQLFSRMPQVHAVNSDGVKFLRQFPEGIHLLYLDGWDVGTPGYKIHHLRAFRAALPHFKIGSLVLIDDTNLDNLGKGEYVIGYALEHGWSEIFTSGQQTLLRKDF